jgi:molecular chaperone DnaK
MSRVLGIDLGTTNSAVAVAEASGVRVLTDKEGYPLIPSVVSFHPSGDVLVGRDAKERRLVDAENTIYSVKRLIGRPFLSPEVKRAQERFPFKLAEGEGGGVVVQARGEAHTLSEISAFVLRKVRDVAEQAIGAPCDRAVVTVPANFSELQRSATKAAGRVAGLDVVRILNEPTAAALAYGYGKGTRERVAIFDLGGGTFDVTLLDLSGDVFEVLATAGDTFLGGDDIDVIIAEQMAEAFLRHHRYDARSDPQAFERLRAASEWAKCELSDKPEVQLRVDDLAYGDGGKALHLKFRLTRETLEGMAQPLIARAFDVCEQAFSTAGLRPSQLDNVILVGGQTRMPLVRRMVEQYFGMAPLADIDPELVVARGAAVQGQVLLAGAKAQLGRIALTRVSVPAAARSPELAGVDLDLHPMFGPDEATVVGDAPSTTGADTRVEGSPRGSRELGARTTLGYDDETSVSPRTSAPPPPTPPSPVSPLLSRRPPPPPNIPVGSTTAKTSVVPPIPMPSMPSLRPSVGAPPAPAPSPAVSSPPPARAPLLLDVTPLTLSVETVAGYCEEVIPRNSQIPAEQSRVFSTAQDNQTVVRARVCQGESRRLEENLSLGEVTLPNIERGPRGHVKIAVTFALDANGILEVSAKDLRTGRAEHVRMDLIGALSEEQIQTLRDKQNKRIRL